MLQTIKLLDVTITAEKEEKVLEYITSGIHTSSKKLFITTPNPEILVYASTHPEYKSRLNTANIALPDGIGLLFGGYLMGKQLPERVTGVDFIEKLCLVCREKPMSMGFLGGRGGVAELAAERLKKKYPWITVAWVGEEWSSTKNDAVRYGFKKSGVQRDQARGGTVGRAHASAQLRSSEHLREGDRDRTPSAHQEIDILFVAFGAPKQEEWIVENLPHLPVKAAMGVGGAFDYLSGKVPRAPKIMRMLGLEWLFRLIVQPWRWRRQLSLIAFAYLILKERFTNKK